MGPVLPFKPVVRIFVELDPMQRAIRANAVRKTFPVQMVDFMLKNARRIIGIFFDNFISITVIGGYFDSLRAYNNSADVVIDRKTPFSVDCKLG
jgi:hypothetical protein